MIYSRVLYSAKLFQKVFSRDLNRFNLSQKRKAGHAVSYRVAPVAHSKGTHLGANLVGAAMWWWILWHLWHESEHITGEFYYPNPECWTNKELGISDED